MQIKIKKLSDNAVVPNYAKNGDAGLDLTATTRVDDGDMYIEYGTALAIEIPEGFVGLLFPRSSISNQHLSLCNSVGILDSGFRGEIKLRFKKTVTIPFLYPKVYDVGDRIGQLLILPYPQIELFEVEELSYSNRGTSGFGSSGL